ncbi:hypothetical protein J6590_012276 [Homalodisca vitripennis]|nr:hypothetical protein J6590_012276 [Homalodisca vitripennis]
MLLWQLSASRAGANPCLVQPSACAFVAWLARYRKSNKNYEQFLSNKYAKYVFFVKSFQRPSFLYQVSCVETNSGVEASESRGKGPHTTVLASELSPRYPPEGHNHDLGLHRSCGVTVTWLGDTPARRRRCHHRTSLYPDLSSVDNKRNKRLISADSTRERSTARRGRGCGAVWRDLNSCTAFSRELISDL